MTDSARRGPSTARWLRRALGVSADRMPGRRGTPARPPDRPRAPLPAIRVAPVDALAEGSALVVDGAVNGTGVDIAVFRSGGRFYALDDICTHRYASLADGSVGDGWVECPVHAARFSLRTGEALCPPATEPERTHRVELRGDEIWLCPGTPAGSDPADGQVG